MISVPSRGANKSVIYAFFMRIYYATPGADIPISVSYCRAMSSTRIILATNGSKPAMITT